MKLPLLAVAALAGTFTTAASAQMIYGVTFFDNQLITINGATGTGSLVTTLSESVAPYGISFRGSDLYTFDATSDSIRKIDTATGTVSSAIGIGVGDLTGEGDLAFRSDGIGFLSSALAPDFTPSNDLFEFDVTLGTSVRIGTTAVPLDGMVFVGDTLYAIGQEADAALYIVNQSTAELSLVGLLGIPMNSLFGGLAATAGGDLFATVDDRLYSISATSGAAMELDPTVLDTGFASISGLAVMPAAMTPVPEPSTYGLIGAALCTLGVLAKRSVGRRSRAVKPAC